MCCYSDNCSLATCILSYTRTHTRKHEQQQQQQQKREMSLSSLSPLSVSVSPVDSVAGSSSSAAAAAAARPPSTAEMPNELLELKHRTHAVQAERDRYKQLGERATDAFEEHRRDLTQLVQKERAMRAHREDALRAQLQEALRANRELMARVVEQNKEQETAWRAELQGHRADNARRQAELESLLAQLHTERAALQRGIAGAERKHDKYRHEIDACLAQQRKLQGTVRILRSSLRSATEGSEEGGGGADGFAEDVRNASSQAMTRQSCQRSRQLCCECCDMPPQVWTRQSPSRRVPRRRFVPAGPWDASSPSRASSPMTHHVDALVSCIERENYLRPRLYLQRCGREASPLMPTVAAESSFWHSGGAASCRNGASPHRANVARLHHTAPLDRHNYHRSGSPGLSSTSASVKSLSSASSHLSTTTTTTTTTTTSATAANFAATTSSPNTSEVSGEDAMKGGAHCSARRVRLHEAAKASPACMREVGLLPREMAGESDGGGDAHRHHREYRQHRHLDGEAQLFFPPLTSSCSAAAAAAAHQSFSGAAMNAACHALLCDLADMRAEYQRYQRQLRDPHGNSVEASKEMRRLMRQMDDKMNQVRALRKEQERHQGSLRVHDVLQQVMAENRYCEAVYKDLMELIRA